MKTLSHIIGFIITILVLYNILRFLFILTENHFNLNFGIDILLHNNYVVYGTMGLLILLITVQEVINQYLKDNKQVY
ncbi:hypothetical protein ACUXJ9_002331 [Staphylococcus caledonicus]|uniref:hypothetical protein n=1 Tax=Staphylococcus TaxID=1279 RepID=UPI001F5A2BA1|nr:hypothetical protein [Staphylococcus sp. acrmy]MCI2948730.1 hypothetical protein [Staphylococcus sp. acrmy]